MPAVPASGTPRVYSAPPGPYGPAGDLLPATSGTPMLNLQVRFEGPIEGLPDGLLGTWTVSGRQVTVGEQTTIAPAGVTPAPGDRAFVRAIYLSGGTLQAVYLAITKAELYQPELVEFSGPIGEPFPPAGIGQWLVGSLAVAVSSSTPLLPAGVEPHVGDLAQVRAWRLADGRLQADSIRVEPVITGYTPVQFVGEIQRFPPPPYAGEWLIGNVAVQVLTSQVVTGSLPAVGLLAEVEALSQADSRVVAQQIRVRSGDAIEDLAGAIQALPADGLMGTWTIRSPAGADVAVQVEATTLIDESRAPAQVGQWALIRARRCEGGVLQALRIRVERPQESGPQVEFSGPILELPPDQGLGTWKVGQVAVEVQEATQVEGVPTVGWGAQAHVKGEQIGADHVRASEVAISYPEARPVIYEGRIESMPSSGLGLWLLSGPASADSASLHAATLVTRWARVTGGTPAPGARVTVTGVWVPGYAQSLDTNLILAFTIEVQSQATTTYST